MAQGGIVLRERQRPVRWRTGLLFLHRWFGLLAAVWLLLLAFTGSAITFYDELDTWLNPELRSVPGYTLQPATSMPVESAIRQAQRAHPGFEPRHIDLPDADGESIGMIGQAEGATMEVFADPRDGGVLGARRNGEIAFERRQVMDLLYGLHIDLLLGPEMTAFLGFVALLWLLDHGIALVLALPPRSRWRDALRIGGGKGSGRRLFDQHRAPGMWLLPVTFVLAFTGVTLAWPEASRDAVRLVSPVSERLHDEYPEAATEPAITAAAAIAIVAAGTHARIDSLRPLHDHGVYAIRTFDPRDLDDQGRLWTYVRTADGSIAGVRHDNGDSAGDQFFAWQYPLHSGKAFGLAGRVLVFAGGIATMVLCVTGIALWWRRRVRR